MSLAGELADRGDEPAAVVTVDAPGELLKGYIMGESGRAISSAVRLVGLGLARGAA